LDILEKDDLFAMKVAVYFSFQPDILKNFLEDDMWNNLIEIYFNVKHFTLHIEPM
jgi:hypothetical protein